MICSGQGLSSQMRPAEGNLMERKRVWAGGELWKRLLPEEPPSWKRGLAVAFACLLIGFAIRAFLSIWLTGAPFLTFYPLIVVSAAWGGPWAGALVIVAAASFALAGATTGGAWAGTMAATVMFVVFGGLMVTIIHALQQAIQAQQAAEREAEIMAREMRHRVSNIMQLVLSIAQLTWRNTKEPERFMPLFEGRLSALSQSHRISSGSAGAPPDLHALLRVLLSPYGPERFRFSGPSVQLHEAITPRIGLIIHELATNAAKYGALSVPEGIVSVEWKMLPQLVEIHWTESNGPSVTQPERQGFGSKLIPAALSGGMGEVETVFAPEGVRSCLRIHYDEAPPEARLSA